MDQFVLPIQVRWSDIDQNRHLRHSAYYDYGAMVRVSCFSSLGLPTMKMEELHIGPILFREEAVFRKEIKFEEKVTMDIVFTRARPDFSRWSIRHQLFKEDGSIAAILNMDGAWIDIGLRKLAVPNAFIRGIMQKVPRAADFVWLEPKQG